MPRPLSNVYSVPEVDYQALRRESVPLRLTPQALLERTKGAILDSWENAIPKDAMGQPLTHSGAPGELLNAFQSGSISNEDETGRVSVGPGGFTITNDSALNPPEDQSKVWSLEVNPSGGALTKGDFAVGGTFSPSKSGFISKGPFRLDAGYGVVDAYQPPADIQDPRLTQAQQFSKQGGPEPWAKLGFEFGVPKEMRMGPVNSPKSVLDQAVSPFVKNDQVVPVKSAREEAEQFINDYRTQNPEAWRP